MKKELSSIKKSASHPKVILSLHRDAPLLHFLWQWKMSTTSAIAAKFYPKLSVWTAYKRLWRLEQGGYIRSRSDESATIYLWTLDKKGFAYVRSRMPTMREEGYLSENVEHDALVSAIHLGEGLLTNLDGVEYFSEQQLRRLNPNDFPEWVPNNSAHRPDGYWKLSHGSDHRVIALEVELSMKGDADYEMVGRHYDDQDEIDAVIWIVDGTKTANKIHRLTDIVSRGESKHSFIDMRSVYLQGWQAKVIVGLESGKSLAGIIGKCLPTDSQLVGTHLLLDARKSPQNSKRCRLIGAPSFLY